jgi:hypothetical protein
MARSTNDLRITITGSSGVLTIKNWYVGTANRIEEIRLADGTTLATGTLAPLSATSAASADLQAQNLVQAMSAFGDEAPVMMRALPAYPRNGLSMELA